MKTYEAPIVASFPWLKNHIHPLIPLFPQNSPYETR